jgi:hypothetical protein
MQRNDLVNHLRKNDMRKVLSLLAMACLCTPAFADNANVSTNPPAYSGGVNTQSMTPNGGLRVQPMDGAGHDVNSSSPLPVTISASSSAATPVSSSALAANQIISASSANLLSFNVSADSTLSAAAWWVMVYNAASAPADGAVSPAKCYAMPSGATSISESFSAPIKFSTGIVIGVSTTGCFTKTSSSHAFISADFR